MGFLEVIWGCFFCIIAWFSRQKCRLFPFVHVRREGVSDSQADWLCRACPPVMVKQSICCVSVCLHRSAAYLHHSLNSALHPRHHKRPVPFQLRWVFLLNSEYVHPWQPSLSASSPAGGPADHDQWPHAPAGSCQTPTTPLTSPCCSLPEAQKGCTLPAVPHFSLASYPGANQPSWSFCLLVLQAVQPCWRQWGRWRKVLELILLSPSDRHGRAALRQGEESWALLSTFACDSRGGCLISAPSNLVKL